jgi:hypothetical protein
VQNASSAAENSASNPRLMLRNAGSGQRARRDIAIPEPGVDAISVITVFERETPARPNSVRQPWIGLLQRRRL